MNRKAQFDVASKTIYWMIAGVLIAMVVLTFAIVLSGYRGRLVEVPTELRAEFTALRFTNIPECFAYQESITGVTQPGIIDLVKFTNEQMKSCYGTESIQDLNFRLQLQEEQMEIKSNNYASANSDRLTMFKQVLVLKDGKLKKDLLVIFVQDV